MLQAVYYYYINEVGGLRTECMVYSFAYMALSATWKGFE